MVARSRGAHLGPGIEIVDNLLGFVCRLASFGIATVIEVDSHQRRAFIEYESEAVGVDLVAFVSFASRIKRRPRRRVGRTCEPTAGVDWHFRYITVSHLFAPANPLIAPFHHRREFS